MGRIERYTKSCEMVYNKKVDLNIQSKDTLNTKSVMCRD